MRTILANPDDDDPRVELVGANGSVWHLSGGGGGGGGQGVALPIPAHLLPATTCISIGTGGFGVGWLGAAPRPDRVALLRGAFHRFVRDIRAALPARPAL